MKTFKFVVAWIIGSSFFLAGCQNTMEGFGKDMQETGKKIENSAHE